MDRWGREALPDPAALAGLPVLDDQGVQVGYVQCARVDPEGLQIRARLTDPENPLVRALLDDRALHVSLSVPARPEGLAVRGFRALLRHAARSSARYESPP